MCRDGIRDGARLAGQSWGLMWLRRKRKSPLKVAARREEARNESTATADPDAVTLRQMRRDKVAPRSTSQGTGRKRA